MYFVKVGALRHAVLPVLNTFVLLHLCVCVVFSAGARSTPHQFVERFVFHRFFMRRLA